MAAPEHEQPCIEIRRQVDEHSEALHRIESQLEILQDIAAVSRGFQVIGRLLIWLGSIGGGVVVIYQLMGK